MRLRAAAGTAGATTEVVDAPIIRLVNTIITEAIKERVSDIHIEPEEIEEKGVKA